MTTQDHVLIIDKNGRSIFARLDPGCRECLLGCQSINEKISSCNISGNRRRGVMRSELGSTYLCSSDQDLVNSSKSFRKELSFFSEMLGNFSDIKENIRSDATQETKRLVHNLTSLNAHILQELYLLVPQEELSTDQRTQLQVVQNLLAEQPENASKAFLKVLQNAAAMKTEFSVFTKLHSKKSELQPKYHKVHKVLLNVASFYFQDFQQINVVIQLDECHNELYVDYETFSVSLHHIFSNAVKYVSHDSKIYINFIPDKESFTIRFGMMSLPIHKEEEPRLFEEGFSGKAAQSLQKAGHGIGMGIAKQLIELNNGVILVIPGTPQRSTTLGIAYAKNHFEIRFPNKLVRTQRTSQ